MIVNSKVQNILHPVIALGIKFYPDPSVCPKIGFLHNDVF